MPVKRTARWNVVVRVKCDWNGVVSRKASRTCAPGRATRSSLKSSIS
jgi:hypothetical protein